MDLEDVKNRIYSIMKEEVEAPELNHTVATDFSETELDTFIGTYLNYLCK